MDDKILELKDEDLKDFESELDTISKSLPRHIDADPEHVEHGLAKLVLTLIELIRKLLEKQALHRVEGGSLTDEEIERLGLTLMKLEKKMDELKDHFGLIDDDLTIDLGPLGQLE